MNKSVLLINAEGVQAICLARSLRKLGCEVIGFCNHRCSSGYCTRYLSERHKSPDITIHPKEFESFFSTYLKNHKVDLIIPLADDGAEFLSKRKLEIEKNYDVVCAIPSFDVFNAANDKQKLMELCNKHDIPHPKTIELNVNNLEDAANYVRFPALIKPNLSQGAKGIMRVDSLDELREKAKECLSMFGACTLQHYVEQPDYYYNVMLYRNSNGIITGSTIIKILRFFPLKGGSSCYSETIEFPVLLEQCEHVLNLLDWKGFADFDVLEDKNTGELQIIEINPRVPSSLQAAFAAGIDFGKVFLSDAFGGSIPSFNYKSNCQVRWMGLDVMWFLFSPDRFKFRPSWFRFFGKNVSYHDGSLTDPLPMIAGMMAGVVKYMNPDFRKSKLKN